MPVRRWGISLTASRLWSYDRSGLLGYQATHTLAPPQCACWIQDQQESCIVQWHEVSQSADWLLLYPIKSVVVAAMTQTQLLHLWLSSSDSVYRGIVHILSWHRVSHGDGGLSTNFKFHVLWFPNVFGVIRWVANVSNWMSNCFSTSI